MRLATFNILHGRSLIDGEVHLGRFSDAVRELDADVLALQEVDRDQPRSHGADLTMVAAEAMGAPEHRFVATLHGEPGLWTAATGDHQPAVASYGIALLSRYPVRSWHVLQLPVLRRRTPVRWPDARWPTLVRDEPRAALVAVVQHPAGDITVVATHLTYIPGWNRRQLRELVAMVRPHPRPLVLAGDLNIGPDAAVRSSGLRPLATAATFPVRTPHRQLDHILGDGPVQPAGPARSVDTGLSDHRALVVDLTLR
ncbi:endonuclease/exonuclease/phosphatase family protein [Cellulomonas fengjieae]|uniref:endonuclease/exonuclease/phosphatase family protein n=1 Tax=Cellulomonas fengjieae TaxID=2819978 RepID=UPI001AAE6694|nr:endonuclease/exonuclease/phosphatase family protein [Cellulomonas fengjieae]MBO3102851.1 endonuclease/exonuclease/phosphatase family protein [Cellulomonas fengjieae]